MENKYYVLQNQKTKEFIAIDSNSGGYPYECKLNNAKIWTNLQEAQSLIEMFPNENMVVCTLNVEEMHKETTLNALIEYINKEFKWYIENSTSPKDGVVNKILAEAHRLNT